MKLKSFALRLSPLALMAAVAAPAHAADVDVAAVAAAVAGSVGPITTISSGVLLVIVTLKVFGWIRKAING